MRPSFVRFVPTSSRCDVSRLGFVVKIPMPKQRPSAVFDIHAAALWRLWLNLELLSPNSIRAREISIDEDVVFGAEWLSCKKIIKK